MEHAQLDILSLILNAGIVVKGVILILISFSIYTWAIVLMKYSYHKRISRESERFLGKFSEIKNIFELPESGIDSSSMNNKILLSTIDEIKKIEETNSSRSGGKLSPHQEVAIIERTIENSITECSFRIRQFNGTLASISSIAPFIGLFGTVWGIINSFQGLAGGGGSIQAVAPGIAEALVATAIGLAAAIPANWFFNKFTSEASAVEQKLINFGKDVINLVERSF
jgi:biopolymer transport protein TolQ